jgi:hypothetical protein
MLVSKVFDSSFTSFATFLDVVFVIYNSYMETAWDVHLALDLTEVANDS